MKSEPQEDAADGMRRHEELDNLNDMRNNVSLALPYEKLGDDACIDIGKFLESNNVFCLYLDLRGNSITPKGGKLLGEGLLFNDVLQSVCLKWNTIGRDPKVIEEWCKALQNNKTLGTLDLRNNRICAEGAKYLGELIKVNTALVEIDLSWNDFGEEGGLHILEGMRHNSTVMDLQLTGCKVGDQVVKEIALIIRQSRAAVSYKVSQGNYCIARPPGALPAPEGISEIKPSTPNDRPWTRESTVTKGTFGTFGSTLTTMSESTPIDYNMEALDTSSFLNDPGRLVHENIDDTEVRAVICGDKQWMKAGHTSDTCKALMMKLMKLERTLLLPEEKLFFHEIRIIMDVLRRDAMAYNQKRVSIEENERIRIIQFLESEMEFVTQIQKYEEDLQKLVGHREKLVRKIRSAAPDKTEAEGELLRIRRESALIMEQVVARADEGRKGLAEILDDHKILQRELDISQKELDNLVKENHDLKRSLKSFQHDVSKIVMS